MQPDVSAEDRTGGTEAGPPDVRVFAGEEQALIDRLQRDRRWAAYMLADLEPPFRRYSRFIMETVDGRDGVVLVFRHPRFSAVVLEGADRALVRAIDASGPLPPGTVVLAKQAGLRVLRSAYRVVAPMRMWRMAIDHASFRPVETTRPRRLSSSDLPAIEALYQDYAGSAFTPDQLDHGIFFGVRDASGVLMSAAGTHVCAPRFAIAAVGNVFTAPRARGLGLAAQVTSAVTAALFDVGYHDIVLNVHRDNAPALAVYRRLGYQPHCLFWEGRIGVPRAASSS